MCLKQKCSLIENWRCSRWCWILMWQVDTMHRWTKRLKATAYEETQRKSKKVIAGRTEEYFIYWWWKEEGHVLRRFLDLTPTSWTGRFEVKAQKWWLRIISNFVSLNIQQEGIWWLAGSGSSQHLFIIPQGGKETQIRIHIHASKSIRTHDLRVIDYNVTVTACLQYWEQRNVKQQHRLCRCDESIRAITCRARVT